jgi:hypothetical protein
LEKEIKMVNEQEGKVIASLSDEGCKLVTGLHPGFLGKMVVTFQHPSGLKFEVAPPDYDDHFEPWMVEFEIYNSFDEEIRTENDIKTIEAIRKYFSLWLKEMCDPGEDCLITYREFCNLFEGFYNGFMAALTGIVAVI